MFYSEQSTYSIIWFPLFSAVCAGRCQNGGVCVYENAMAGCKCLEGFSGELCEIGILYFNQFMPYIMLDYYSSF